MRSDIFGIAWPAVKVNEAAMLAALVGELKEIQWMRPNDIKQAQHDQLAALLKHHEDHTPSFYDRLHASGLTSSDITDRESLRKLKPISRRDWQSLGSGMFSTKVPSMHGKPTKLMTSGSTGEPVVVQKTMLTGLFWAAHSLMDHEWHHRDLSMRMISIRADIHREIESPNWGYPMAMMCDTGPAYGLPITTDIAEQASIIDRFKPELMITYPSNLSALLEMWERNGNAPALRHIKTVGETVSDGLRRLAKTVLGLDIEDGYSSNELGTIALHCGHCYHTMDDNLIVEVLDEDGNDCRPGQIGRIVATDLHNFATPVIRYEIGDYAEVGDPCSCGRGYGTINRILGRERNLIRNPDGTTHWPLTGFYGFRDVADIKQYQMIQHDHRDIELKLVTDDVLTDDQQARIADMVRSALRHDFNLRLTIGTDPLPKGKNGKFEEFICEIR